MLKVQEYLNSKSLQSLVDEFAINVKRHKLYPNLVLLKYNQLNTPMNPLTRECRGLILDEANNWKVVCYTYKRFQNWGEGWGDTIDWNTCRCVEKVDGSLIQLYYYDDKWMVATSGTCEGSGLVGDHSLDFAQLFWNVWIGSGYQLPTNTNHCYAFELLTPYNQLVVRQINNRIVLHGVRDLSDFNLTELQPEPIAAQYNWECVKSWPLTTIEEVLKATEQLDPLQAEGFVCVDGNFNRIKVKSTKHVLLSHMRDNLTSSRRNIIEIIRKNEGAEFLAYFEELAGIYNELKAKYDKLVETILATYNDIKDIQTQKDYAAQATKYYYSGALFQLRRGVEVKQFLLDMVLVNLECWLEKV